MAVTGTICTGKSRVARLLGRCLATRVLDVDHICRQLLKKEAPGWHLLREKWGTRFLVWDGAVDRPLLRKAVFDDARVRADLEQILHPLARREIRKQLSGLKGSGRVVVVEVPLLFEVGWQEDFDRTVLVYASPEICVDRVMGRDGVSRVEGGKVIAAQMDIDRKVFLADSVVENSGSWFRTALQVYRLASVFEKMTNS